MLIDVHAHLDNEKFKDILPKIIDECKLNKVQQIINNGLNFQSNLNSLNLAKKYDIIKAALGLYPLEAEKITNKEFDNIVKLISDNSKNIIAIGEIGLDGKYGINHELQEKYFVKLIKLARELNKPIIVHSRCKESRIIELLNSNKMEKVIMHSYTGNMKLAREVIDNNWFFSIPPSIINSKHFQLIVDITPEENLLTETDSPYQYTNNEFNKPSFVSFSIQMIAKIKNITETDAKNKIFQNFKRIFINSK